MNVAIIPARGGSKRIPRKNVKLFHGKPIIAYSIEAALKSNCFDQVVVSTDDQEISDIAKHYGAIIPFTRPSELATDEMGTLPVIEHALRQLERQYSIDFVCLIYPTAPMINPIDIRSAYEQIIQSDANYVFSVATYPSPVQRAFTYKQPQVVEMLFPEYEHTRSQELAETYHDAAQFYWGKFSAFREQKPVFMKGTEIYPIPRWRVQDIDTLEDWDLAERLFAVQLADNESKHL